MIKKRQRVQGRNSLPQISRTGIIMGSKNWQKGGFTQHIVSNYFLGLLFQSMAHFLCSQCFNDQKEVEASRKEFFSSNFKNRYHYRIKDLAEGSLHLAYSLQLAPSDYCSNLWLTSCTTMRWKVQWRSSLPLNTRTAISMRSKNWQKGEFRRYKTMAATLNAWMLSL